MIIKRHAYENTGEYVYVLQAPHVDARVDKLFFDSVGEDNHPAIEVELAKRMFYTLFRQLQEMHKNGELPKVVHK